MNWFALGAGGALIIAAATGFMKRPDGEPRLSRPVAVVIGLIGLMFVYLSGALEAAR